MEDLLKTLAQIWRFLLQNPVILVLVIAWIAGGIGKILKSAAESAQKRRQRAESGSGGLSQERLSQKKFSQEQFSQEQLSQEHFSQEQIAQERINSTLSEPEDIGAKIRRQLEVAQRERDRDREKDEHRAHSQREQQGREKKPHARRQVRERVEVHEDEQEADFAAESASRQALAEAVASKARALQARPLGRNEGGTATAAQARHVRAAFVVGELRRAVIASEILQPPLSLRDDG